MSRLRLAIVTLNFDVHRSGEGSALRSVVEGLRKKCDVTVFASTVDKTCTMDGVRFLTLPSIRWYPFLVQFISFNLTWSIVRSVLATRKHFDVYLATSPVFFGVDAAFAHYNSAEFVARAQGRRAPAKGWRGWLTWRYRLVVKQAAARMERRALKALADRGGVLIPVAQGLAESLARQYADLPRVRIIPNPVDLARFAPGDDGGLRARLLQEQKWNSGDCLVLFVGGDWERKGLRLAIEALALLPSHFRLIVVGRGDRSAFAAIATTLGVDHRVAFVGPQRDTVPWYRVADLLLLPSLFEALPLVCIEALACGVPIVVTPYPGAEEVVHSEAVGAIVPADAASVATGVERVAIRFPRDSEARQQISRHALRFSPETIADKLLRELQLLRAVRSGQSSQAE